MSWKTASRRRIHVLDQARLRKYILLLVLELNHIVLFIFIVVVRGGPFQFMIEKFCQLIGMILNFLPYNCPLGLSLLR